MAETGELPPPPPYQASSTSCEMDRPPESPSGVQNIQLTRTNKEDLQDVQGGVGDREGDGQLESSPTTLENTVEPQDTLYVCDKGIAQGFQENEPPIAYNAATADFLGDSDVSFHSSSQWDGSQDVKGTQCITCEKPVGHMSLRCRGPCTGKVHFFCSRLPAYQIANLYGSQRKYTCEKCTPVKSLITRELREGARRRASSGAAGSHPGLTIPPSMPGQDESVNNPSVAVGIQTMHSVVTDALTGRNALNSPGDVDTAICLTTDACTMTDTPMVSSYATDPIRLPTTDAYTLTDSLMVSNVATDPIKLPTMDTYTLTDTPMVRNVAIDPHVVPKTDAYTSTDPPMRSSVATEPHMVPTSDAYTLTDSPTVSHVATDPLLLLTGDACIMTDLAVESSHTCKLYAARTMDACTMCDNLGEEDDYASASCQPEAVDNANDDPVTLDAATQTLMINVTSTDPLEENTTSIDKPAGEETLNASKAACAPYHVLERIGAMETTISNLVKGLCEDLKSNTSDQLSTSLKLAQAEVRSLKSEKKLLEQKIEGLKKDIKERDVKITSHKCDIKCDCKENLNKAAVKAIEQEARITEREAEIKKLRSNFETLQVDLQSATREADKLQLSNTNEKDTNSMLATHITELERQLEASKEHARSLEQQIEASTVPERENWKTVPMQPVTVKGEDNPLSNFFPCQIQAYNKTFDTVEHALQYKKLFDHDKLPETEEVRGIADPKDVKRHAAETLGTSLNLKWENRCESTMRLLLAKKKEVCPDFVRDLEATGDRHIKHNVASPEWGTGKTGEGKNRFGKILMDLRREWFGTTTHAAPVAAPLTTEVHTRKPHLAIIGNSLTKGIVAEKVSRDFTTSVDHAANIKAAKEVIASTTNNPDIVAFQLATNDVRDSQPEAVLKEFKGLIETTKSKLPKSRIVVSLAPFSENGSRHSSRLAVVNAALQDTYHDSDGICVSNRNIDSFAPDRVHLTRFGTSLLVRNIKRASYKVLNIQASDNHNSSYHRRSTHTQHTRQPAQNNRQNKTGPRYPQTHHSHGYSSGVRRGW